MNHIDTFGRVLDEKNVYFQYSIEEQFTGKYWVDGKKIYTRSYFTNTSGAEINIAHNISNIGTYRAFCFDGSFWYHRTTFECFPLSAYVSNVAWSSAYSITNTHIQIRFGSSWVSVWGLWVTILYTKNE